jgi:hypothetical protein
MEKLRGSIRRPTSFTMASVSRYPPNIRLRNTVRFRVGDYDHRQPLIIDPSLSFGTYIGKSDSCSGTAIAFDSSHNVYIAGDANSSQYPTTAGTYQTTYNGTQDVFVSKLSSDGSTLLYSTYVGGSAAQAANAIAVDSSGNAHVAGGTLSTDFPVTPGALDLNNGSKGHGIYAQIELNRKFATLLGPNRHCHRALHCNRQRGKFLLHRRRVRSSV